MAQGSLLGLRRLTCGVPSQLMSAGWLFKDARRSRYDHSSGYNGRASSRTVWSYAGDLGGDRGLRGGRGCRGLGRSARWLWGRHAGRGSVRRAGHAGKAVRCPSRTAGTAGACLSWLWWTWSSSAATSVGHCRCPLPARRRTDPHDATLPDLASARGGMGQSSPTPIRVADPAG